MRSNIPYMSLSSVVKEYCLASMNDPRKYFINFMVHAKWIFKELHKDSLFAVKNTWVKVDKTTNPYSVVIPADMMRFINFSIENKQGKLRSFVFDDTMSTMPPPSGDICNTCHDDNSYGQCINNIIPTVKSVIINGQPYTEKTWKKLCPNGDIQEIREIPVLDVDGEGQPTVTIIPDQRTIANVEVKSCGCVKKTAENKRCIEDTCGLFLTDNLRRMAYSPVNLVGTRYGRMKIAAGRIWLEGNVPDYGILSYQTNGVCGEDEIMVPEYMVNAMLFGIKWRSKALADGQQGLNADRAKIDYLTAVEELDMYLNPIRMEEFMNVQMTLPLWGSEIDQSFMRSHRQFYDEEIDCLKDCNGLTIKELEKLIEQKSNNVTTIVNNITVVEGHFEGVQDTLSMEWIVVHNLGFNPNVTTVDQSGQVIYGEVGYPGEGTTVSIKFNSPVKGKVHLS